MSKPDPGDVHILAPGLRAVLAPNPGPMTHWGTNSFIFGEGNVAIIDPGPDNPAHFEALVSATKGERISHILVTHAHADHSPLSRRLSQHTGAPILGFGPPEAGRSATMTRLAQAGLSGGGEGVDPDFAPDQLLRDGDRIQGAGWSVDVFHTPGHFAGHLAFGFEHGIVSGDHVMDWASSLVSPPDGNLTDFMTTSARLRDIAARRLFPGHGAPIADPADRLNWLIEHRRTRETAILNTLGPTPQPLATIARAVYIDIEQKMLPAAERNVFAHLIDLVERNLALATPNLSVHAQFAQV